MVKKGIKDYSFENLTDFLVDKNIKKFRAKQICDFIYKRNVSTFDEIKNLPKQTIQILKDNFTINALELLTYKVSKDKTVKFAFKLYDGEIVESVLIVGDTRATACVSTQVGCPVKCSFCATGRLGYKRNLTAGEIFNQVFALKKYAEDNGMKFTNIVYMGMGEPFLNYNNVILSIKHISSDYGLAFSSRRITVSTSGVVDGIRKLAKEDINVKLAISLHTADNDVRDSLIPINKKYSLDDLKEALKFYYSETKNRISIEYLMLGGVNDRLSDVKMLLSFCKSFPVKINLIEYNEVDGIDYHKSESSVTDMFVTELEKRNLVVNVRRSRGEDIDAACGQLANKLTK